MGLRKMCTFTPTRSIGRRGGRGDAGEMQPSIEMGFWACRYLCLFRLYSTGMYCGLAVETFASLGMPYLVYIHYHPVTPPPSRHDIHLPPHAPFTLGGGGLPRHPASLSGIMAHTTSCLEARQLRVNPCGYGGADG